MVADGLFLSSPFYKYDITYLNSKKVEGKILIERGSLGFHGLKIQITCDSIDNRYVNQRCYVRGY